MRKSEVGPVLVLRATPWQDAVLGKLRRVKVGKKKGQKVRRLEGEKIGGLEKVMTFGVGRGVNPVP